MLQSLHIVVEHDCVKRYDNGLRTALGFLLLFIAICIRSVDLIFYNSDHHSSSPFIFGHFIQLISAIISLVGDLSLPRRPSVFEMDHVVDGQYTVSAFSSYTFGFAGRVLSLARNKASLDLVDLPYLHLWGRSSFLLEYFGAQTTKSDRLWKSVIYAHYPELLFQCVWAVVQSALQFAPQFAMYKLLQLLERRSKGAYAETAAWGLVVALGVAIILAAWAQAWEHWICWARLGQPIRAELSAMIFNKSLRRKDVKSLGKSKQPSEPDALVETNDLSGPNQTDPVGGVEESVNHPVSNELAQDDDEDIQKSRQSTINLVVMFLEFPNRDLCLHPLCP